MGMKKIEKKLVFILLLAMVFNIFAPFAGINEEKIYAETEEGIDVTKDYLSNTTFNDFSGWKGKTLLNKTWGTQDLVKNSNNYYPIKANIIKKDDLVYLRPLGDGKFKARVLPLVSEFNGEKNWNWTGGPSVELMKKPKDGALMKFSLTIKKDSGEDKKAQIYVRNDENKNMPVHSNDIIEGSSWANLNEGERSLTFSGKGTNASIILLFNPVTDKISEYTFSNLKIFDITPAGQPSEAKKTTDDLGNTMLEGKAVISDKDKRNDSDKRKNFQGDRVEVYSEDGDKLLGSAIVNADNKWEIKLDQPIGDTSKLYYKIVNPDSNMESNKVKHVVGAGDHKVVFTEALEGNTTLKGIGFPGDEILFVDQSGKQIGEVIVDPNGNFEANLDRPLKLGEKIAATPYQGNQVYDSTTVTIEANPFDPEAHKPIVDEDTVKEGSEEITGKGQPGDEIVIKDKDGNTLGNGTVDEDGNFKIELERPLKPGDELTLTPKTDGKEGTPLELEPVEYDKELHKPNIENAIGGEEKVTGTGVEGDNIVITDENGIKLGEGEVTNGKFEINLNRPLKEGEKIKAQAIDGENKSEETEVEVTYSAANHKPELDDLKEGEEKATGRGTPGDIIVITDEKGNELGTGEVGDDGKFEVGLKRPLEKGETIKATPKTGENEGEAVEKEVGFNEDYHKPEVDEDTVKEGSKEITGKGQPGDEIVIKDKDGKELGKGTVDEDGNFKVDLNRPLKPGDELTLTPKTDGKEGTPLVLDPVEYDKDLHKPNVENAKEGEEVVTGIGIPGDTIVIRDSEGIELGRGEVGTDGKFEIGLERPLKEGEKIKAQAVDGENKSEETEVEVTYSAANHKPELDDLKEGDEKATGRGTPGDIIVITDEKGNELGREKVGDDGKFEVGLNRPLEKGETIKATPKTGENEGQAVEKEVEYDEDYHKPEVDEDTVKDGSEEITGKGQPGDQITVTDKDGNALGTGEVGNDGNFKIELERPLKPGDELTLTPKTDGKEGTPLILDPVEYDKDYHKPNIEKAIGGEEKVTGKGAPGDNIVITDEKGNELGRVEVNKDGNFNVNLNRPLKEGETITATPETKIADEVKKGEPVEKEVGFNEELHTPIVDKDTVKEGSEEITGKGVPGDEIVIKDKDGKELGTGKVDEDGNFKVDLNRPLKPGDELTLTPNTDGKEGTPLVLEPVEYDKDYHKPNIEKAKEGEKEVTVKGIPGDEIIITDKDGNELGKGEVDGEGNFKIEIDRPLKEGEEITAKAKTGEEESEETKVTVTYEASKHKPELDDLNEGEKKLTGRGTPGDTIVITDEKGNELGREKVGDDGKFEVDLNRPLEKGETIKATPKTGENEGEAVEKEVGFNKDYHKPEVDKDTVKEGSEEITGKGQPGDKIVIKDKDGNELGKGEVSEDGNFKITLNRPLKPGDELTLTPNTDGKEGTPLVLDPVEYDKDYHKPNIEQAVAGEEKVTGKGAPGDTIVITDEGGNELGRVGVDEDGNFNVNLNRPLKEGETIIATPETKIADEVKKGEPVEKEVGFNEELHTPIVDKDTVKEGSEEITGKGVPGDEIVIKDKDGNELGKGTVDEDGNFKVDLNRPLKPGDELTLTPNTDGKEGTPLVLDPAEYNKELHKPNIEKAIGGEEKVTGTGIPGDNVVIRDETGKELGSAIVGEDGKFNIDLTRPLKEGEKIKAQAVDGENKSEETEVKVTYNASNHKPTLNPAKEGDTKVTGIGIPGDEIIIKDKDGNELGRGKVDKDGKFEITVAPLMLGKLTAIPVTNGNEGEEGEGEIDYNPEAHKPNIEKAKEGEREVTGKGVPGDEIVITDKDGNELGKGRVDKDGNFKVDLDRPLKEGEEVTAKAKTGDKESEDTKVTVSYKAEKHKPKLDPVEEGDTKVTGTGTPGDEIIVKDKDGNELGRGKVDKDGKFEINLDKPLKPGKIIATPVTNGNEGESLTLTVDKKPSEPSEPEIPVEPIDPEPPFDKDKHKPEVEEIYDGDKIVSGKGVPGDEIVITDKDGNELGKGRVDKNGNFKVELTRPVKEGEVIVARPNTNGNKGTESTLTVSPKKEKNIYDKLNSEDHIAYIQGFENGTVRPESTVTREQVSAVLYRLLKPSYRDTIKTTKTSFKDVGPKRWSRKHIGTLENGNIINGTGYGNFSPARNITKAELVVMLSRLEKLDTRPNNDFTDIKGHWAEAEIKSAANKGWINGHGNNKFQPDKHLTRAEFVTIINNVLNRKVEKKDILPEAKGFKDLKKDKWYYEAMMEAINSHHYERKDNGFEKWTDIYYPNLDM